MHNVPVQRQPPRCQQRQFPADDRRAGRPCGAVTAPRAEWRRTRKSNLRYLELFLKFGCNTTEFRCDNVLQLKVQFGGTLTDCNALKRLGILASVNFVRYFNHQ